METHTLPYVKQTASGNRPCDTGGSTLRGGTGKKMGGGFRREGAYVNLWLIHTNIWQKPTKYYKAIILQLKKKLKRILILTLIGCPA